MAGKNIAVFGIYPHRASFEYGVRCVSLDDGARLECKETRAGQVGCTTHSRTKQQSMDSLRTGIFILMYLDYLMDVVSVLGLARLGGSVGTTDPWKKTLYGINKT